MLAVFSLWQLEDARLLARQTWLDRHLASRHEIAHALVCAECSVGVGRVELLFGDDGLPGGACYHARATNMGDHLAILAAGEAAERLELSRMLPQHRGGARTMEYHAFGIEGDRAKIAELLGAPVHLVSRLTAFWRAFDRAAEICGRRAVELTVGALALERAHKLTGDELSGIFEYAKKLR
jgi:hypothetical protein